MGFLDNLTEIATDLAQSGAAASKHLAETGIATSKRLAEIAKLKTSNLAEEGSVKKAYAELGRLYYAEHGNTPEGEMCIRDRGRNCGPGQGRGRSSTCTPP